MLQIKSGADLADMKVIMNHIAQGWLVVGEDAHTFKKFQLYGSRNENHTLLDRLWKQHDVDLADACLFTIRTAKLEFVDDSGSDSGSATGPSAAASSSTTAAAADDADADSPADDAPRSLLGKIVGAASGIASSAARALGSSAAAAAAAVSSAASNSSSSFDVTKLKWIMGTPNPVAAGPYPDGTVDYYQRKAKSDAWLAGGNVETCKKCSRQIMVRKTACVVGSAVESGAHTLFLHCSPFMSFDARTPQRNEDRFQYTGKGDVRGFYHARCCPFDQIGYIPDIDNFASKLGITCCSVQAASIYVGHQSAIDRLKSLRRNLVISLAKAAATALEEGRQAAFFGGNAPAPMRGTLSLTLSIAWPGVETPIVGLRTLSTARNVARYQNINDDSQAAFSIARLLLPRLAAGKRFDRSTEDAAWPLDVLELSSRCKLQRRRAHSRSGSIAGLLKDVETEQPFVRTVKPLFCRVEDAWSAWRKRLSRGGSAAAASSAAASSGGGGNADADDEPTDEDIATLIAQWRGSEAELAERIASDPEIIFTASSMEAAAKMLEQQDVARKKKEKKRKADTDDGGNGSSTEEDIDSEASSSADVSAGANSDAVAIPGLKVRLRSYQSESVDWMLAEEKSELGYNDQLFCRLCTEDGTATYFSPVLQTWLAKPPPICRGGILAEEMGLGKVHSWHLRCHALYAFF